MEEKKYHLYVLYNVKTMKPVYIGLSCSIRNRIYKHEKNKKFDGVLIIESFKNKNEGLAAERCLIKFFSYFQLESIINGLYINICLDNFTINLINKIKNGRLD